VQLPEQSTSTSVPFFTLSEQVAATHLFAVHTPLEQSDAATHGSVSAHFAQVPPPQSVPVSLPFLAPSAQVGVWQTDVLHTPLLQSVARPHDLPGTHFVQLPPQSTSDSLPFLTKSVQAGTLHLPPLQTPLVQSEETLQSLPSTHLVAQVGDVEATPPQSTSVSVPFFTPSMHLGARQTLPVQTLDWQSVATAQALLVGQRLHVVLPPQSTSVSL